MFKSTINSELEAEQLLTSQTNQFNLWTEHQYPLREGWVGFTARLVHLGMRKTLSLVGLQIGCLLCWLGVGRSVGRSVSWWVGYLVCSMTGGVVGTLVGWSVGGLIGWLVGGLAGWLVGGCWVGGLVGWSGG